MKFTMIKLMQLLSKQSSMAMHCLYCQLYVVFT